MLNNAKNKVKEVVGKIAAKAGPLAGGGFSKGNGEKFEETFDVVFGAIWDTIKVDSGIDDGRASVYWVKVLFLNEEDKQRSDVTNWMQLALTTPGYIKDAGRITSIALNLIRQGTDGFKKKSLNAKDYDKSFRRMGLGNHKELFGDFKIGWDTLEEGIEVLKKALKKAEDVLKETDLNEDFKTALDDILKKYKDMMKKAVDELKKLAKPLTKDPEEEKVKGTSNQLNKIVQQWQPVKPLECPICKQPHHDVELDLKPGNNKGKSQKLKENMYPGNSISNHPNWSQAAGGHSSASLQAHHLIPCKTMKDSGDMKKMCSDYFYDIDTRYNGVMLPSWIDLACQRRVPLHKAKHDFEFSGYTEKTTRWLKEKIDKFVNSHAEDKCNVVKFHQMMNGLSEDIYTHVMKFRLPLTKDWKDYHPKAPVRPTVNDDDETIEHHQGCCQFDEKSIILTKPKKEKAIEDWKKKHKDDTGKEGVGLCVKDRMHGYNNDDTFVANGRERTVYTIGS